MRWLQNGNARYLNSKLRKDGQGTGDRTRLVSGQTPHTIILSCSDSRVPPEIVFDQKLGEIFVVRTAGEALDNNVVGSIEYAVEHLGSKLLVVMGHSSCGAVKAALSTMDGTSAGTPALDALVKDLHPRLASFKGKKPSADAQVESLANARGVAGDLLKRSKLLKEFADSGKLRIVASLYDLSSGKVKFDQ
ncbi:MAG: carbonic anhydrase [Calothrix sp. SM1_5_4]|nr:carbonic anhydrase [Calothrix sp. SM1_5_4]